MTNEITREESRGYRLEQRGEALAFVVDGQAVGFKLLELVDRMPHTPTEEEKLAVRQWESLQRKFSGAKNLDTVMPQPQIPELDFVPSGRLQVEKHDGQAIEARGAPLNSHDLRRVFG